MKHATNATFTPPTRTRGVLTCTEATCVEFGTLSGPDSIRNALARNGVTDVARALLAREWPCARYVSQIVPEAQPQGRSDAPHAEPDPDTGEPVRGVLVALLIELVVGAAIGLALATWLAWVAGWIG